MGIAAQKSFDRSITTLVILSACCTKWCLQAGASTFGEQQIERHRGFSSQVQFDVRLPPQLRWHNLHRAVLVQVWSQTGPMGATEGRAGWPS